MRATDLLRRRRAVRALRAGPRSGMVAAPATGPYVLVAAQLNSAGAGPAVARAPRGEWPGPEARRGGNRVGKSLVIGRVRGIEIKVHPTFLLIVPWVAFNWGYSGGYGPAGIAFGFVLMILLFAFVVLHALGHSFAAMRYGVGVRDITLFPIGGVARIEQLPAEPRRELAIALAGPAVNLAIALLFAPPVLWIGAARGVENPLQLLGIVTDLTPSGFIVYLFFTNVMLVLFNLLPAFPMDGGRVLRAVLSHFTGRLTATRVAVVLGQLIGAALCALGLGTRVPSLALVGAFIIAAAYVEGTAVRVEHTMRKLRVGQFILWDMGGIG